jgi:hypothetical protein
MLRCSQLTSVVDCSNDERCKCDDEELYIIEEPLTISTVLVTLSLRVAPLARLEAAQTPTGRVRWPSLLC